MTATHREIYAHACTYRAVQALCSQGVNIFVTLPTTPVMITGPAHDLVCVLLLLYLVEECWYRHIAHKITDVSR